MPNEVLCADVSLSDLSDEAIVKLVSSGNTDAFGILFGRYEKRLLHMALGILRNQEDGEDAVQEGFLDAFRNIHKFEGKSLFYTWLFRCVANKALMRLRRRKGLVEGNTSSIEDQGTSENQENYGANFEDSWNPSPEKIAHAVEIREAIETHLDQLSPTLRTAFTIMYVQGYSVAETARKLDVNENTVKARVWRARAELKGRLSDFVSSNR